MRRKFFLLFVSLFVAIQVTACGKDAIYQSGKEGYTSITAVDGVSFDLVSNVVRNATAITNISEDMEFEADCTYLYKDGETSYFLFNMKSITCIVQKDSNFGFYDAQDKLSALKEGNILGVYLTSPFKKKLEYEEVKENGYYKMIATATAQVSLTSELYNDFAGKLAVIYDGTTEWAFFVGSIGNDYNELDKDIREAMSYMAATFAPYQKPEQTEPTQPPVSIGGENEIQLPEASATPKATSAATPFEDTLATFTPSPETIETPVEVENVQEEMENVPVPTQIPELEETNEFLEEETIEIEVEEDTPLSTTIPNATTTPTPTSAPTPIKTEDGRTTIVLNNQKNTFKEDTKVYISNIYDMLTIGKMGYASVFTGLGYENAIVKVDKIYTGKEAENLIKKAFKEGILVDNYFEPMQGCTWHVVHYTVDFNGCSKPGYVNVKLRGLDGENLRFRGIEYSQRTYDIPVSETEFYSYYAVPNACYDYALEIGEGNVEYSERVSAYYLIKF